MTDFWYLIVNPAAGGGAVKRLWPRIERDLQKLGFSYTVKFTEGKMHAARLAEDGILKGYRNLLAIGGDGTVHEVANGILAQDFAPSRDITLALLPVGTGNDWARQWSISGSPTEVLKKIQAGKTAFQDAGLVRFLKDGQPTERFFINVAGMAYDGFIAREVERNGTRTSSPLSYYSLIVKCLWKYELGEALLKFAPEGQVSSAAEADWQTIRDQFYTINIGLCKYSGGGMQFVPQAIPDDGLFGLTFARRLPKWEVILQTPRFFNGKLGDHPKVTCTQTRAVKVENLPGQPPVLLEADGEFLGEAPAEFVLLEKALKVIV